MTSTKSLKLCRDRRRVAAGAPEPVAGVLLAILDQQKGELIALKEAAARKEGLRARAAEAAPIPLPLYI